MEPAGLAIEHFAMVKDIKNLVYIAAVIAWGVVAWSLYLGYKRWTYGGERIRVDDWSEALRGFIKYGLFQYKVLRHRFPGTMHLMIFSGMIWLFIATTLRALDTYFGPFLTGDVFKVYKFLNNIAGLAVLLGVIIAAIRRYMKLTPNLPDDKVYYVINALFAVIVVTGFALDGLAAAGSRGVDSPLWDPIGYPFYTWAQSLDEATLTSIYRQLWVFHMLIAHLTIALIPFTNLWHIPAAGLNILLRRQQEPVAATRVYEDINERIDNDLPIGVVKLADTTWKQRLDYDACTSCMRCTNSCPAFASGKPLSPRDIIVDMRAMMHEGEWDATVWEQEDGKIRINPDAVWSCVTCGACVNECPVLIHHVDTILDIRRGMMSTGSEQVPEDALNALYNMQQMGNPLGTNPAEREEWLNRLAEELGDDIIADPDEEYDYLYFTGCVASYDERIRSVPESVLKLLRKAGVKVAVLPEEVCSGEPAKRMGEEALFIEMMKMNLEVFSQYKFKKLLVHCPHCYTIFKHEYKKYRSVLEKDDESRELVEVLDRLDVEHHSVVLARLVEEGKIEVSKEIEATVTYHDPCYLGRWNGIYEEPRRVLGRVKGLRIREMPRNRERSFCCGGGGGHMFFEIKQGKRISRMRAEEAAQTLGQAGSDGGERIVAVACPFCNTMFRAEAEDFKFKVKDISEILAEASEK